MIGMRSLAGLFRTSLRARVAVLMVAIFVAISIPAWLAFDRIIDTTTIRLGRLFAEKQVLFDRYRGLETLISEAALARTLARSPAILAWAAAESDPEMRARGLAEMEHFRRAFRDGSAFVILDASGNYYFNDRQQSYAGKERRYAVDPGNPRDGWYFTTLAGQEDCQLNVDHDDNLGVTKVWVNCKIQGADGRPLGIAGTGIDLSSFIREVVDAEQKGVESIFVDQTGAIQAHRDAAQIDFHSLTKDIESKNTIFNLLDRPQDRNAMAAMMARGAAGGDTVEAGFVEIGGRRVLAGIGYLDRIGWYNITLMDIDEIIDDGLFRPIAALLVLILVAATVLATLLFKRCVLDRLATLEVWAGRLRSGDFSDMRPPMTSSTAEDEIGRLTHAFGEMARTVGDNTHRLEAMVRARTETLERIAHLDPLTGVENRRGFLQAIPPRRAAAAAEGVALGLVLVDLDLFKPVNDRHGHQAGDRVLVEIAQRLGSCLRDGDLLARWGGDEFVLLLGLGGGGSLMAAAELVRRAVIDTPYLLEDGTELPISASIGACPLPVGMPLETALEQADTALYAAKHGGRNRVALAGDPIPGAIRHSG